MKDLKMKIRFIKPSCEIDMMGQTGIEKLKHIEKIARLCYKTEERITEDSYEKLIRGLIKNDHTAMIEHASFAVKFIANRAFTHELVRHRPPSFAQESQRYVGYGDVIEFIIPNWIEQHGFDALWDTAKDIISTWKNPSSIRWGHSMLNAALDYSALLELGWKPEQARDILPNACKTEIWITTNLREWKHIFKLRDHHTASPQMRELMGPLHKEISKLIPIIFDQREENEK
jgi:thymidylate synthase (FAD)